MYNTKCTMYNVQYQISGNLFPERRDFLGQWLHRAKTVIKHDRQITVQVRNAEHWSNNNNTAVTWHCSMYREWHLPACCLFSRRRSLGLSLKNPLKNCITAELSWPTGEQDSRPTLASCNVLSKTVCTEAGDRGFAGRHQKTPRFLMHLRPNALC